MKKQCNRRSRSIAISKHCVYPAHLSLGVRSLRLHLLHASCRGRRDVAGGERISENGCVQRKRRSNRVCVVRAANCFWKRLIRPTTEYELGFATRQQCKAQTGKGAIKSGTIAHRYAQCTLACIDKVHTQAPTLECVI